MEPSVASKVEAFFGRFLLKQAGVDEVLIRAGEDPPGIFYLVSGQVKEYDISGQGNEVVVNVYKPPAFFPMSWAINQTPNRYFFETIPPSSFRQAPAEQTLAFLKANPDVVFDLLSRVYSGTNGLLRRMAHLMGSSARTRLLFEILIECRRFGRQKLDGSWAVKIHENELANRAGLSRETVSRELTKIKELDLVDVDHSGISIKDPDKLEEALGDDL